MMIRFSLLMNPTCSILLMFWHHRMSNGFQ